VCRFLQTPQGQRLPPNAQARIDVFHRHVLQLHWPQGLLCSGPMLTFALENQFPGAAWPSGTWPGDTDVGAKIDGLLTQVQEYTANPRSWIERNRPRRRSRVKK
jgi:hypothetical protein